MLLSLHRICKQLSQDSELIRILYRRAAFAARTRGQMLLLAQADLSTAQADLSAAMEWSLDRNRTIDRLIFQLRAIWSWMVRTLTRPQILDATHELFSRQAQWQPTEVLLAVREDEVSDIVMGDILWEDP